MIGLYNLNPNFPARVLAEDKAPTRACPSHAAAGGARRCTSGTTD